MKEQKIKFGLTVPYIVIFVIIIASIVLWGICSGPRQRSFFECEKKIAETILNFKLAVFSDEPILMRDAKNIYYPSELEQLLIANYGLGKDFQYSPLFIIIQLNSVC